MQKQQPNINSHSFSQSSMDDFEIISELGKGSFGFVYKVRRKTDNIIYALKKVSFSKLNSKEKENSLNEIRILASLHNKHVIEYKDAFYDNNANCLCLIMEFAEHGDLDKAIRNRMKEKRYYSEYEIISILIQITKGLKNLHDNNIMHRDIKSANIFIFENNIFKIGDLNVSKILKNDLHHTQTGTPYYASPEVWDNHQYDNKCDIWSLGCLLYELTTLKPPFRGSTMKIVYEKVKDGIYEPIPKMYSKSLAGLIYICLQIIPKNRPTCEQLLDLINKKINTFNLEGQILEVYEKGEEKYHPQNISINNSLDNIENEPNNSKLLSTIKVPNQLNEINSLLPKNRYIKTATNNDRKINRKPFLKLCGGKLPKLNIIDFRNQRISYFKNHNLNANHKTIEHSVGNKIGLKYNYSDINVFTNHSKNKSDNKLDIRFNNLNYIDSHVMSTENEIKEEITNRQTSTNKSITSKSNNSLSPKQSQRSGKSYKMNPTVETTKQEQSPVKFINQECPYLKQRSITTEGNSNHNIKGLGPRSYSQHRMKMKCDVKSLFNPLQKIKSQKNYDRQDLNELDKLLLGIPLITKYKNLKTIEPNLRRFFNRPINIHRKYLNKEQHQNTNINNAMSNQKVSVENSLKTKQEAINELREDISKINEIIKNISSSFLYDSPNCISNNNRTEANKEKDSQKNTKIIKPQESTNNKNYNKSNIKTNPNVQPQSRAASAFHPRNLSSNLPSNGKLVPSIPYQLSQDILSPVVNLNQLNHQFNTPPQNQLNIFLNNKPDVMGNEYKSRINKHKHNLYKGNFITNDSDLSRSGLPSIEKSDTYINPTSPNSIKIHSHLSHINELRNLTKEKEQQVRIPKMIPFALKNNNNNNNNEGSFFAQNRKGISNPIKLMPLLSKGNNNFEIIEELNRIDKKKKKINKQKFKDNLSDIDRVVMNINNIQKMGI